MKSPPASIPAAITAHVSTAGGRAARVGWRQGRRRFGALLGLALACLTGTGAHAESAGAAFFYRHIFPGTKVGGIPDVSSANQSGGVTKYSWALYLNPSITPNTNLTQIFAPLSPSDWCPGCDVKIVINGTTMNPSNTGDLAPNWEGNPDGKLGGWQLRWVSNLCYMITELPDGPWYCDNGPDGSIFIYKAGVTPPSVVVQTPTGTFTNPSVMFPAMKGISPNPVQTVTRTYPSSGSATTQDGSNTGSTTGGTTTSGGSSGSTTTPGG